jgi:DNA-directed RNA polymerase subunit K/omega
MVFPACPALSAFPANVLGLFLVMEEALETPAVSDQPQAGVPLLPTEPVPPIHSRFLFVDVAALRAKQLRRGARLRILADDGPLPKKAERLAMEEVKRGLVMYDVPPPKGAAAGAAKE